MNTMRRTYIAAFSAMGGCLVGGTAVGLYQNSAPTLEDGTATSATVLQLGTTATPEAIAQMLADSYSAKKNENGTATESTAIPDNGVKVICHENLSGEEIKYNVPQVGDSIRSHLQLSRYTSPRAAGEFVIAATNGEITSLTFTDNKTSCARLPISVLNITN